MALAIQGIRINSIDIDPTGEGKNRIKGSYSLMSTADKVLAKQAFNGYNDIEVAFSAETVSALNSLLINLKRDVQVTLGINEGE
jgi:hypothetical protein